MWDKSYSSFDHSLVVYEDETFCGTYKFALFIRWNLCRVVLTSLRCWRKTCTCPWIVAIFHRIVPPWTVPRPIFDTRFFKFLENSHFQTTFQWWFFNLKPYRREFWTNLPRFGVLGTFFQNFGILISRCSTLAFFKTRPKLFVVCRTSMHTLFW